MEINITGHELHSVVLIIVPYVWKILLIKRKEKAKPSVNRPILLFNFEFK